MAKKRNKRPKIGSRQNNDDDVDDADPNDEKFFYDEIDEFHANKEKILLGGDEQSDSDVVESEEEEVLGIESDDDDYDEGDIEGDDSDEENAHEAVAGSKAWGQKKSMFYGADTHEALEGSDREEAEREEEEEVLAIQRRLAEQIDEEDCGLDLLQTVNEAKDIHLKKDEIKSHIVADFSSLSKKAQWKLAKRDSPELEGLLKDFNTKVTELENEISPLITLIQNRKIPKGYGSDFIHLKYRVYLAYLLNISFYMTLKTSKAHVQHHPVISRLVQYRTVINRFRPIDEKLKPEIEELLKSNQNLNDESNSDAKKFCKADKDGSGTLFDSDVGSSDSEGSAKMTVLPRRKRPFQEEKNEQPELQDFSKSMNEKLMEEEKKAERSETESEEEEEEGDERRAINYEIAKNKGLKQKRKKADRNPRVKMRQKYRKAKIRRRGQVREYKPEIKKYAGEHSGIRIGLKKSVTLQ